ncbi:DNA-binding protein [Hymenobacter persicinus]|uniref:DNA-binding protein n=1 Tax=Hymenobacter persicinus TaxID=2025506 RepID=A0A4Q5L9D2_9BACT|nr:DNA-binding protein [Hymenobacter persicinus]RYU78362.1 DNA-binding protein [Hymenobacter persicinus]
MTIDPQELRLLGNADLLQLSKTAFFCSRHYPNDMEREANLWALEQRARGQCIVSGFHSQLEQQIFRYLLQGPTQPIVYVLARGIQPNIRSEYGPEIRAGRLLFVTPFEPDVTTSSEETTDIRNLLIAELAQQFFVPFLRAGGQLEQLFRAPATQHKPIFTLDLPDNQARQLPGAQLYQPNSMLGRHGG